MTKKVIWKDKLPKVRIMLIMALLVLVVALGVWFATDYFNADDRYGAPDPMNLFTALLLIVVGSIGCIVLVRQRPLMLTATEILVPTMFLGYRLIPISDIRQLVVGQYRQVSTSASTIAEYGPPIVSAVNLLTWGRFGSSLLWQLEGYGAFPVVKIVSAGHSYLVGIHDAEGFIKALQRIGIHGSRSKEVFRYHAAAVLPIDESRPRRTLRVALTVYLALSLLLAVAVIVMLWYTLSAR